MGSDRFTLQVILHSAAITAVSFLNGILFYRNHDWDVLVFFLLVTLLVILSLIHYVNRAHRDVAYFFEAVVNEDSSLHYPTESKNKYIHSLHANLNRINQFIQYVKIRSAVREKYFHALLQHSATGLVVLSEVNEIEIINNRAAEFAGLPPNIHPSVMARRQGELYSILQSIKPGETRVVQLRGRDAQLQLSVHATEIRHEGRSSKVISMQDIRHELVAKEVETWQKLIRVLTHEIMNSVAPITSLTTTLRKFYRKGEQMAGPGEISEAIILNTLQGLDTIEERGTGLLRFVENYRKLMRVPAPVPTMFLLAEWIEKVRMLLSASLAAHRVHVEVECNTTATITADENLLSHVLLNLLHNAMDVLKDHPGERKIRVYAETGPGGGALIRVMNNGPQIPLDIQDKIFIPFFTTKENGSGIGLSLSRQIMTLHGGFIDVESGEGQTTFTISL